MPRGRIYGRKIYYKSKRAGKCAKSMRCGLGDAIQVCVCCCNPSKIIVLVLRIRLCVCACVRAIEWEQDREPFGLDIAIHNSKMTPRFVCYLSVISFVTNISSVALAADFFFCSFSFLHLYKMCIWNAYMHFITLGNFIVACFILLPAVRMNILS